MDQTYITYISHGPNSRREMSIQEIMDALYSPKPRPIIPEYSPRYYETRTVQGEPKIWTDQIDAMNKQMEILIEKYRRLEDKSYSEFFIPKHSGGIRTISAPSEELKGYLRDVTKFFQETCKMHAHNAAFAYTPGRCVKDALIRHQSNKSRWFLKLDLKDFFPCSTGQFIFNQLTQLHPTASLDVTLLSQLIESCLLKGSLPQGSPASPILTNLIMIPIDHTISNTLWDFGKSHYIYTRYADDLLISNEYDFNKNDVITEVQHILSSTPYIIKMEKTRYGSSAGRNWNLGLMLTQDNQITVGHKRKERMKAGLHNLFTDFAKQIFWPVNEFQVFAGTLAYLGMIEPEYTNALISKAESKYGLRFKEIAKRTLNQLELIQF